jgi:hypothetical protein
MIRADTLFYYLWPPNVAAAIISIMVVALNCRPWVKQ